MAILMAPSLTIPVLMATKSIPYSQPTTSVPRPAACSSLIIMKDGTAT
ncbi:hypothetical protein EVA_04391 [gut metagenome]|uniref:Uncharacterized protein n=1 Tax=gut metagenome TaxID=749906 RepID=J9GWU6_9ZZZZ